MNLKNSLLTAFIALAAGFAGAGIWSVSGLDDTRTREYLISNPEILPEMVGAYEQEETAERLAEVADVAGEGFPGAILGNPNGSVTLIEFTDYGCTYCRSSVADVQELIAENPELKVIVREWPIFDGSDIAARMALAAAKQGKFEAFHAAMFEMGPPGEASVVAAANRAGLDMERAQADAVSSEVDAELDRNRQLARSIGFSGTPSWIAGSSVFEGAVGKDTLAEALENGSSS